MGDIAQVNVTGLAELRKSLRDLSPELLKELKTELKEVATVVATDIRAHVPVRSGTAQSSVRAVSGGNTVYIVGGSAKAPYFPWLDFGGTLRPTGNRRNTQRRETVKGGRYMYPGVARNSERAVAGAAKAFDRATKAAGFT